MSAVTCHFERRACRHSTLFMAEYKRTNRTKKTKQTETVATVSTSNSASLLVYAHFEEAQTNFLALNDVIGYDEVSRSIQTEQTPKGTWIEGTVVRDAGANRSSLFQINPGARWYYEWESAATKAQRFTKHALRVYIFQRVQSQLRVVGLISSSEFIVVSYRRAPGEVRAEREALEALRTVVDTQQIGQPDADGHSTSRIITAPFERKPPPPQLRVIAGREEVLWQNRKLWECRHPDIMTTSKHLAILFHFLRHLNASSHGASLEALSGLFNDQVAGYRSVTGKVSNNTEQLQLTAPLSWIFLEPLRRVEKICTSLAGWLALDCANLEVYRRFLGSYSPALLDKDRVRAGYVEAVKTLCKLVDRFIGWSKVPSTSSSTSLSLLSEEIMTAVFKYDHLTPLRRVLLDVLSSNEMFGMHEFVSQLRAQYVLQHANATPSRTLLARQGSDHASVFDGSWVFDGTQSLLTPIRGSTATDASLSCLLTFMRELARIDIRPVDGQSLEICSDWNLGTGYGGKVKSTTTNQSGMTLVLDGRQRMFIQFPSGVSSSIPLGGRSYGDYRGKVLSPKSFVVEMSSWPVDSDRLQPALRWKLQADVETGSHEGSPRCLLVNGVMEEGYWRMDSSSESPDFEAVPFNLKLGLVEAWYPMYELVGVYDRIG
ncbi:uncharacterized protein PITG_10853 [Phytophthora infestans T30-4]|uniref:Uncharacterized protein n=1 Tax=Phytophthora infestans (strain T30-4) TaxID=403677 RepID=D0NH85_PHYIT|nr:uncharacterized protein PITG_10853 [Phytophthora infestans T30-4]EEY58724.1 conserved hypothetical protein [Phytophthora infestans T30-4]|eukprot:XP_002901668.1 conserved hypothetical protein [Phytophthora infestans T30-4]